MEAVPERGATSGQRGAHGAAGALLQPGRPGKSQKPNLALGKVAVLDLFDVGGIVHAEQIFVGRGLGDQQVFRGDQPGGLDTLAEHPVLLQRKAVGRGQGKGEDVGVEDFHGLSRHKQKDRRGNPQRPDLWNGVDDGTRTHNHRSHSAVLHH